MRKIIGPLMFMALVAASAITTLHLSNSVEAQGMPKEFKYGYFLNEVAPKLGEPALAMHAKDPDGKEVDLKQFLGKWVLMEFGSYT